MTRFDLRAPNRGASASVFVYGWADQRGPACLFVSFMYRGIVWLLIPWRKNWNIFLLKSICESLKRQIETPDLDLASVESSKTCMCVHAMSVGVEATLYCGHFLVSLPVKSCYWSS